MFVLSMWGLFLSVSRIFHVLVGSLSAATRAKLRGKTLCFFCRSSFASCCSAAEQLAALAEQMSSVEQLFTAAVSVGGANSQPAITQSLRYVRGQVEAYVTDFTTWKTQLLCLGPQPSGECLHSAAKFGKAWKFTYHIWMSVGKEHVTASSLS